jgi:DNA-binding transcriptional regulator YhcF (GntR family)
MVAVAAPERHLHADSTVGVSATVQPSPQVTPEQAWALAPLIAGQPAYRAGQWVRGKFQYPGTPRKLTAVPPGMPAAVLIHDAAGRVTTLCLDLDTSKAAQAVVDADAERLGALLASCGLRYVEDFSPAGGRHLYVPLADPMDGTDAGELVAALARTAPSMDASPHQNPSTGCIRVPGALHKRGGHQQLITPLWAAYDILKRRNTAGDVDRLRRALAPELRRNRQEAALRAKTKAAPLLLPPERGDRSCTPGAGWQSPLRRIAQTGLFDTARYRTPSEARMAVLNHFAACGWTLEQVRGELSGQFQGLASLYQSRAQLARLLEPEWTKALEFTASRQGKKYTPKSDTSPTKPTGGAPSAPAIHQLVNDLENVLYAVLDVRFQKYGREGIGLRFLLRAVLAYMRTMETNTLDVGCRTFALALGQHHSTVARLLRRLAQLSDGMVTKIADARHRNADVYLIELPEQYRELARDLSWRQGKIHAVRAVFRALGPAAALAYEAIERGRVSPTVKEVAQHARIGVSTAERALAEMSALGMIHRDQDKRWHITHTMNLTQLAQRLGADQDVAAQLRLHRLQRAAWHAWLDRYNYAEQFTEADLHDPEADEYWIPPDDEALLRTLWRSAG